MNSFCKLTTTNGSCMNNLYHSCPRTKITRLFCILIIISFVATIPTSTLEVMVFSNICGLNAKVNATDNFQHSKKPTAPFLTETKKSGKPAWNALRYQVMNYIINSSTWRCMPICPELCLFYQIPCSRGSKEISLWLQLSYKISKVFILRCMALPQKITSRIS